MAAFRVTTSSLQHLVTELENISASLEDALTRADQAVERMHQQWAGDAASAHLASHQAWAAQAQQMKAALTQLQQAAGGARSNYTAAADASVEVWS